MKNKYKDIGLLFLLLLVVISIHLPLLLDNLLPLDRDEAVVGLMAKHSLEGKGWSLFFYGQSYGLAIIEVAAISLFYALFGISVFSLKLAMLVLWSVGGIFFFLAVRNFTERRTAFLASVFLVFCPGWFLWSMRARGGYVSGFLLVQIFFWLLSCFHASDNKKTGLLIPAGLCAGLIFHSQPLWVLSIWPFFFLTFKAKKKLLAVGALSLGFLGGFVPIYVYGLLRSTQDYWMPNVFYFMNVAENVKNLPYNLWVTLTGAYSFQDPFSQIFVLKFAGGVWLLLLMACLFYSLRDLVFSRSIRISQMSLFSIMTLIFFALVLDPLWFSFRYFLPVSFLMILILSEKIAKWDFSVKSYRYVFILFLTIVIVSGGWGVVELKPGRRDPRGSDEDRSKRPEEVLVENLMKKGIYHVYCFDPMTQWKILFYSGEKVLARGLHPQDRYPEYGKKVDEAFFSGKRTALSGELQYQGIMSFFYNQAGMTSFKPEPVAGKYFVSEEPDWEDLNFTGFNWKDEDVCSLEKRFLSFAEFQVRFFFFPI